MFNLLSPRLILHRPLRFGWLGLLLVSVACGRLDFDRISDDAIPPELTNLTTSVAAPLVPSFSPSGLSYRVDVKVLASAVQVTPTALDPDATIWVNGNPVASGTASPPIALDLGDNAITVDVTTGSQTLRYEVVVVRAANVLAQVGYGKASNTDAGDRFGYKVSLSGDTLAVGAPGEASSATGIGGDPQDNTADGSGAVYIFQRSGAAWTQQAYVKASNSDALDNFGWQVSLSGDTLAVGAPEEASSATGIGGDPQDNTAASSGAVYIFQRSGATWTQQAYIKASNADAGDRFGWTISVSGDTLAVGARHEASNATGIGGDPQDNTAADSGAAYIFQRSGASWTQQAYIKASNTDANDRFGRNLSLAGDTLAVAAYFEASSARGIGGAQQDNSAAGSGAIYIFQRSGATWTQQAYIKASNTDPDDRFGWQVSLSGDTLAVGAYAEASNATGIAGDQQNNSAAGSGAVYIFQRSGTSWAQQAYIKASNTDPEDRFGRRVSVSGNTLAVGSSGEASNAVGVGGDQQDNNAAQSGAVYIFQRSSAAWAQQTYVKASNTDADDLFGISISLSGDTLVVGSSGEASNATGIGGNQQSNDDALSGAIYIFQ